MNLNISYNWLKEYVKLAETPAEFAKKISLSGPAVDHLTEIKPNFEQVVVGQILKIEQHPNADKLKVCQVTIGDKQPLNIVCGASNIAKGQKVPVVLVGGKVGKMDVARTKIRGVESEGMMCSQKELGIGEDHTGIYILPDYVEIGLPLEKVMPISDTILDMEVTSNRSDAMSVIGIAREAAAILGEKFKYQEPKPNLKIQGETKKLKITVKEPKLCPRYQAAILSDIKVGASPLWLQQRLLASGLRPINNLVDITNYILLEFGQPLHVFDYDKLSGQQIIVRLAQPGEKILALDGKEYELSADNLVIADGQNPCAVAGVMGGELSAAKENTRTIVFEAANFDPVSVRRTARALNLHSESSDLYEKGLSPEATNPALLRAIELTMELADGKLAGEIIDIDNHKFKAKKIAIVEENVAKILGLAIKKEKIKSILESLGFGIDNSERLKAIVPWWRDRDIEGEHDLIEEIARIYGYHNLPTELMAGELPVDYQTTNAFKLENQIKDILCGFGLTEIYTYSFISEKLIKACGFDVSKHLKIANPLNSEFEYLRLSLLPSALQIVSENIGNYPQLKLFELSNTYEPLGEGELAAERLKLSIVCVDNEARQAISDLKGIINGLTQKLFLPEISYALIPETDGGYWTVGSSADMYLDRQFFGRIALINNKTSAIFGIKKQTTVAEINFDLLADLAKQMPAYAPLPKYPAIELDLSIEIDSSVPYGAVVKAIRLIDESLIEKVEFLSIYEGDKLAEGKKALAVRLIYRDKQKTLLLAQAQAVQEKVVAALKKEYNIKVR